MENWQKVTSPPKPLDKPFDNPAGEPSAEGPAVGESAKSEPVQWACQLKSLLTEGSGASGEAPPQNLTVGSKFLIRCEGPPATFADPVSRDGEHKWTVELPKEQQYALRILSTRELREDAAEFVATSWTAGQLDFPNPVITDGQTRIALGPLQFNVSSVLPAPDGVPQMDPTMQNAEKPAQGPTPYPPWAPVTMPWPSWIWIVLGVFVLIVLSPPVLYLRNYLQRRKLLTFLASHQSPLTPYNQFNKDLRKLGRIADPERVPEYFNELDACVRWYLAREFKIQAIEQRPHSILRGVKRIEPELYKEWHRELSLVLTELRKAISRKNFAFTREDAHQLTELSRKVIDGIAKARSATRRRN